MQKDYKNPCSEVALPDTFEDVDYTPKKPTLVIDPHGETYVEDPVELADLELKIETGNKELLVYEDDAEKAEKKADALGLEMVLPDTNEVQIDLDSPGDIKVMRDGLKILKNKNEGYQFNKLTTSKSNNKHVYIKFDRTFKPMERIVVQACLGSDRKRELLGMMRVLNGTSDKPSLMFEDPHKAYRTVIGHKAVENALKLLEAKEKF